MRWRTFFQLLVPENGRVLRLEAEEGGNLARHLGVVLLGNRQLVDANNSQNLEPAGSGHHIDSRNSTRDVIEVEFGRWREQSVGGCDELRTTDTKFRYTQQK